MKKIRNKPNKGYQHDKRVMQVTACISSSKRHNLVMQQQEYIKLVERFETAVRAKKQVLEELKGMPEAEAKVKGMIASLDRDLADAKRLTRVLFETCDIVSTGSKLEGIPKSVGEMLDEYIATQKEPFTVQNATLAINGIYGGEIGTSAVSQALRRMKKSKLKVFKAGKGPLPTYYQRV